MPLDPQTGVPAVVALVVCAGGWHDPEVGFERIAVAIWEDGTIVWSEEQSAPEAQSWMAGAPYLMGRVARQDVDGLVDALTDLEMFADPNFERGWVAVDLSYVSLTFVTDGQTQEAATFVGSLEMGQDHPGGQRVVEQWERAYRLIRQLLPAPGEPIGLRKWPMERLVPPGAQTTRTQ